MSGLGIEEDQMINLLPGFRFHPSDEELITHYLCKKVQDSRFCAIAMGEADLNKSEPWELPYQAKIGEKEWYFFVLRDKKYPTGLRTNRATVAGYWKATGKDKEIYRGKSLVGMKKTLVFYRGRAPKGEKTNWVMHEYRLEGKLSLQNLPQSAKTEWVICRVFEKTSGGKKIHISGMVKMSPFDAEFDQLGLPPLTDSLPSSVKTPDSLYVSCFSNQANFQTNQEETLNQYNSFARIAPSNSYYSNAQIGLNPNPISQYQTPYAVHDHAMIRGLLENNNGSSSTSSYMRQHFKTEREMITASQETGLTTDMNNETSSVMSNLDMGRRRFDVQEGPSSSIVPFDPDCIWNYNY